MKSSKLIMGCLATLGLAAGAGSALAQDDAEREAIAERLKPVGEVCLQGEECGTAMAAADSSGDGGGDADGETIYGNVCAACHDSGAAGAPVRGEEEAWAERADQGFETLLDHAINGIGAMPARGGNPNLSDAEVEAALAHLVEPVMEVPELGGDEAAEEEAPAEGEEEVAAEEDTTEEGATEEEGTAEEEGATAENGGGSDLDGEALYGSSGCAACHDSGAAGAPMIGDAEAWGPRIDKGVETLYESAINGIGAMPPKGGSSASDEEIQAIVDYMVSQAE